jgi:hypothetical protein
MHTYDVCDSLLYNTFNVNYILHTIGLRAHAVLDDDAAVLCNDPGITNAACRLLVVT